MELQNYTKHSSSFKLTQTYIYLCLSTEAENENKNNLTQLWLLYAELAKG